MGERVEVKVSFVVDDHEEGQEAIDDIRELMEHFAVYDPNIEATIDGKTRDEWQEYL